MSREYFLRILNYQARVVAPVFVVNARALVWRLQLRVVVDVSTYGCQRLFGFHELASLHHDYRVYPTLLLMVYLEVRALRRVLPGISQYLQRRFRRLH